MINMVRKGDSKKVPFGTIITGIRVTGGKVIGKITIANTVKRVTMRKVDMAMVMEDMDTINSTMDMVMVMEDKGKINRGCRGLVVESLQGSMPQRQNTRKIDSKLVNTTLATVIAII